MVLSTQRRIRLTISSMEDNATRGFLSLRLASLKKRLKKAATRNVCSANDTTQMKSDLFP